MDKKILATSFLAVILGFIAQITPMLSITPFQWWIKTSDIIKKISPDINLGYFNQHIFTFQNYYTGFSVNFLDLSIYLLLFIGIIACLRSRGKEIRLIRFSFSIILLSKVIFIVRLLIFIVKNFLDFEKIIWYLSSSFASIASNIFWLIIALFVTRYFLKLTNIEKASIKKTTAKIILLANTSKYKRFLHHVLDLFLSIIICGSFMFKILLDTFKKFQDFISESLAILIIILFSRFLYLVFFEFFFGVTPSKFLTGTRVVTLSGIKPNFRTIILRSLYRNIPFEAFSFLGKDNGWHDRWSKTTVVNEENPGIDPKKYLWILPLFVCIGILSYIGKELKDDYNNSILKKTKYESAIKIIEKSLNNLDEDYFIEIKGIALNTERKKYTHILKVESVKENSVLFTYFESEFRNYQDIERYYEATKEKLPTVEVLKSKLQNSFTKDYDDYKKKDFSSHNFIPETEVEHYISRVFNGYKPNLKISTSSSDINGNIYFGLENDQWPAKIIKIENLKGNLNWLNKLPQKMIKSRNKYYIRPHLTAKNFKYGEPYKIKIIISDSLDRIEEYIIEGVNDVKKLTKVAK